MLKRGCKYLISLGFIAALFSAWSTFAFADPFAGAVVGAMGAMGATIGNTGATTAAFSDFISNGNTSDPYQSLDPTKDYYIRYKKNAYVDPDTGFHYDEVWYSNEFAKVFQDEGIAFLNDNSIQPNSSDILKSGFGYLDGIPLYEDSVNTLRTQYYYFAENVAGSGSVGNATYEITYNDTATNPYNNVALTFSNGSVVRSSSTGIKNHFSISRQAGSWRYHVTKASGSSSTYNIPSSVYTNLLVEESFEFDYVAASIDITPITSNKGLRVYVPAGTIDSSVQTGLYRYNHGGSNTDIEKINNGVTDGAGNDSIFLPEFTIEPEPEPTPTITPEPTIPPVPIDTPLGEVPYDDFIDTFGQSIYSKLDSIRNVADTIGQRIESILEDVETAIDTAGQSIEGAIDSAVGTIGGILTDIKNAILSIPQYLTQILEAVITHPLDMFDAFLDAFMEHSGIGGLLDELKERLGIWHYVVEWLQCIGGVFRFFFGIMSSVAYCMVVPIYALVAGSICLAIYKRFGR